MQTHFVPIAGGTGSGKTTLARAVAAQIQSPIISIDDYYRPFSSLSIEDRKRIDFDTPEAIDVDLLVEHVRLLRASQTIHKPLYDAAAYSRLKGTEPVYPNPLVVIEGLFALHWPALTEQACLLAAEQPAAALVALELLLERIGRIRYYPPQQKRPSQPRVSKQSPNKWCLKNRSHPATP